MGYIQNVLQGSFDQEQPSDTIDKGKQVNEALLRLSTLENMFELNPKVKNYFENGKLYYSYITGGGLIGSIDTITYDERYAAIVDAFEKQTSYLVYHVIEYGTTISLLYVSDDYNHWIEERPTIACVRACIVNVDSYENEFGYIKIDCLNGALYRINEMVFSTIQNDSDFGLGMTDIESEIVSRLEILKDCGLETDLDITNVYVKEHELCCTIQKTVMGVSVGIVNRSSTQPLYAELLKLLNKQDNRQFYFIMGSNGSKIAFLFLSEDKKEWEDEKLALEKGFAKAIVVDTDKMTATTQLIKFQMLNGGPVFKSE